MQYIHFYDRKYAFAPLSRCIWLLFRDLIPQILASKFKRKAVWCYQISRFDHWSLHESFLLPFTNFNHNHLGHCGLQVSGLDNPTLASKSGSPNSNIDEWRSFLLSFIRHTIVRGGTCVSGSNKQNRTFEAIGLWLWYIWEWKLRISKYWGYNSRRSEQGRKKLTECKKWIKWLIILMIIII